MKYMYLVENFVPFPQSDGGVFAVIAENDDECFDLISNYDDEQNLNYYSKLRENINKSLKYALLDEHESTVVYSFLV